VKAGEFPGPTPGMASGGITLHDVTLIPTGNSPGKPMFFFVKKSYFEGLVSPSQGNQ
jgi:hypothetical protein